MKTIRLGDMVAFQQVPTNDFDKPLYETFGYVTYMTNKSFFVLVCKPKKEDGLEVEFSYESNEDLDGCGFMLE